MSRSKCPIKDHRRVYFQNYDMYACLECDVWLDEPCGCPSNVCSFKKPPRDPRMVTDEPEYL